MFEKNIKKRNEWRRKLSVFNASGLSGVKWCHLHEESYAEFCYYKSLYPIDKTVSFQELSVEAETLSPLEVSAEGITIRIHPPFDIHTIDLCLSSLRKNVCSL